MADQRSSRPVSEEKTASASYILSFYQNVQQFTANYSQYLNFMLIVEAKFKDVDPDKIDPAYKEQIVNLCGQLRFFANACYIQYSTVAKQLKLAPDTELIALQTQIETTLVLKRTTVKEYVIKLNEVLATEVMKSLLISSQSIVDSVFNQNADTTSPTQ